MSKSFSHVQRGIVLGDILPRVIQQPVKPALVVARAAELGCGLVIVRRECLQIRIAVGADECDVVQKLKELVGSRLRPWNSVAGVETVELPEGERRFHDGEFERPIGTKEVEAERRHQRQQLPPAGQGRLLKHAKLFSTRRRPDAVDKRHVPRIARAVDCSAGATYGTVAVTSAG